MTFRNIVLIGTAALSLAACATEYTRPDTSEAQRKKDLEECQDIAYGKNPGDWTPDGPDYQARNSVGCPSGDCQAKPGQAVHGSPSVDMNRADRERAVLACMESRGYSY
ncbi:MAG: hypothetical protein HKO85_00170 [Xanthomonadales bacterium]|nr:hypothetical protein [Gammaproteobacteria bacterium]MBT8049950.1 hypothetical protein [Gammaproteobacteria bacterium]MBT8055513.1 hypothetical protein [Gammaproteobacteria bacterium]NNJ78372.1 hypothetical protein [Xanthomonadales bacterium]NNL03669.1 hypothetical protein [Xanthomonadales bacterium]